MMNIGRDFERMRDYLIDRLPEDERLTFERQLLRDPQLARELEQALQLREGLGLLRLQGRLPLTSPRRTRALFWLPALVAAGGAGLVLFLWVYGGPQASPVLLGSLESRVARVAEPWVAAHFTFVSARANSTPALQLPTAGLIEFRAAPAEHTTVNRYRVTLLREDAAGSPRPVGTLDGLTSGTDGYVHFYADASRLAEGSYAVRIAPDPESTGTTETFPFTLRIHPESTP
jgi:hypothetical protein